jgi:hypothetical protein
MLAAEVGNKLRQRDACNRRSIVVSSLQCAETEAAVVVADTGRCECPTKKRNTSQLNASIGCTENVDEVTTCTGEQHLGSSPTSYSDSRTKSLTSSVDGSSKQGVSVSMFDGGLCSSESSATRQLSTAGEADGSTGMVSDTIPLRDSLQPVGDGTRSTGSACHHSYDEQLEINGDSRSTEAKYENKSEDAVTRDKRRRRQLWNRPSTAHRFDGEQHGSRGGGGGSAESSENDVDDDDSWFIAGANEIASTFSASSRKCAPSVSDWTPQYGSRPSGKRSHVRHDRSQSYAHVQSSSDDDDVKSGRHLRHGRNVKSSTRHAYNSYREPLDSDDRKNSATSTLSGFSFTSAPDAGRVGRAKWQHAPSLSSHRSAAAATAASRTEASSSQIDCNSIKSELVVVDQFFGSKTMTRTDSEFSSNGTSGREARVNRVPNASAGDKHFSIAPTNSDLAAQQKTDRPSSALTLSPSVPGSTRLSSSFDASESISKSPPTEHDQQPQSKPWTHRRLYVFDGASPDNGQEDNADFAAHHEHDEVSSAKSEKSGSNSYPESSRLETAGERSVSDSIQRRRQQDQLSSVASKKRTNRSRDRMTYDSKTESATSYDADSVSMNISFATPTTAVKGLSLSSPVDPSTGSRCREPLPTVAGSDLTRDFVSGAAPQAPTNETKGRRRRPSSQPPPNDAPEAAAETAIADAGSYGKCGSTVTSGSASVAERNAAGKSTGEDFMLNAYERLSQRLRRLQSQADRAMSATPSGFSFTAREARPAVTASRSDHVIPADKRPRDDVSVVHVDGCPSHSPVSSVIASRSAILNRSPSVRASSFDGTVRRHRDSPADVKIVSQSSDSASKTSAAAVSAALSASLRRDAERSPTCDTGLKADGKMTKNNDLMCSTASSLTTPEIGDSAFSRQTSVISAMTLSDNAVLLSISQNNLGDDDAVRRNLHRQTPASGDVSRQRVRSLQSERRLVNDADKCESDVCRSNVSESLPLDAPLLSSSDVEGSAVVSGDGAALCSSAGSLVESASRKRVTFHLHQATPDDAVCPPRLNIDFSTKHPSQTAISDAALTGSSAKASVGEICRQYDDIASYDPRAVIGTFRREAERSSLSAAFSADPCTTSKSVEPMAGNGASTLENAPAAAAVPSAEPVSCRSERDAEKMSRVKSVASQSSAVPSTCQRFGAFTQSELETVCVATPGGASMSVSQRSDIANVKCHDSRYHETSNSGRVIPGTSAFAVNDRLVSDRCSSQKDQQPLVSQSTVTEESSLSGYAVSNAEVQPRGNAQTASSDGGQANSPITSLASNDIQPVGNAAAVCWKAAVPLLSSRDDGVSCSGDDSTETVRFVSDAESSAESSAVASLQLGGPVAFTSSAPALDDADESSFSCSVWRPRSKSSVVLTTAVVADNGVSRVCDASDYRQSDGFGVTSCSAVDGEERAAGTGVERRDNSLVGSTSDKSTNVGSMSNRTRLVGGVCGHDDQSTSNEALGGPSCEEAAASKTQCDASAIGVVESVARSDVAPRDPRSGRGNVTDDCSRSDDISGKPTQLSARSMHGDFGAGFVCESAKDTPEKRTTTAYRHESACDRGYTSREFRQRSMPLRTSPTADVAKNNRRHVADNGGADGRRHNRFGRHQSVERSTTICNVDRNSSDSNDSRHSAVGRAKTGDCSGSAANETPSRDPSASGVAAAAMPSRPVNKWEMIGKSCGSPFDRSVARESPRRKRSAAARPCSATVGAAAAFSDRQRLDADEPCGRDGDPTADERRPTDCSRSGKYRYRHLERWRRQQNVESRLANGKDCREVIAESAGPNCQPTARRQQHEGESTFDVSSATMPKHREGRDVARCSGIRSARSKGEELERANGIDIESADRTDVASVSADKIGCNGNRLKDEAAGDVAKKTGSRITKTEQMRSNRLTEAERVDRTDATEIFSARDAVEHSRTGARFVCMDEFDTEVIKMTMKCRASA